MKLSLKVKLALVGVTVTVATLVLLSIPFDFLSFLSCSDAFARNTHHHGGGGVPEPALFAIIALVGAYFGFKK